MYRSVNDLPQGVKGNLPAHGQRIYKEAFNSAMQEYHSQEDTESTAHRVAWSAVKKVYEKHNNTWRKK